jgi:hypothetical protein
MLQTGGAQARMLRLTDWALRVRRIAVVEFAWPLRRRVYLFFEREAKVSNKRGEYVFPQVW